MNRRSFLGFLGIAPVAAPAVAHAAMAPTLHTGGRVVGKPYVVGSLGVERLTQTLNRNMQEFIAAMRRAEARRSAGGSLPAGTRYTVGNGDRETHTPLADCNVTIRTHNTAMACASTARAVRPETAA